MATHTIHLDSTAPATLDLPSAKFSETDKKEIKRIEAGLERVDASLDELNKFTEKASANEVIGSWVEGKSSLSEAILAAGFIANDRKELTLALRGCAKGCARSLRIEGSSYLAKAVLFKADAADKLAEKKDAAERKEAEAVGVIYTPSGTLLGIRKTATVLRRRATELQGGSPSVNTAELQSLLD